MNDFHNLIKEYIINHRRIDAPYTSRTRTHSGIIILIDKQYGVLHSEIKIPGRMINLQLLHNVTTHEYNLTA